jgi:hypothetical protein
MAGPFDAALAGEEAGVAPAGGGGSGFEQAAQRTRKAKTVTGRYMVILNG